MSNTIRDKISSTTSSDGTFEDINIPEYNQNADYTHVPQSVNYCYDCRNYHNTGKRYIDLQREVGTLTDTLSARDSEVSDFQKAESRTKKYKNKLEKSISSNKKFISAFVINSLINLGLLVLVILFIYNYQNDNDIIENLTNSLILYGLGGIGILGYYIWVFRSLGRAFVEENNSISKGDSINSDI